VADPGRLSPSYESQLAKYACRGFRVAVPGFPGRSRINSSIYLQPFAECSVSWMAVHMLLQCGGYCASRRLAAEGVLCFAIIVAGYVAASCRHWRGLAMYMDVSLVAVELFYYQISTSKHL
jgi:hypothetical protein